MLTPKPVVPDPGTPPVVDPPAGDPPAGDPPEEFTEAAPWQAQNAGDNKTNPRLFPHRSTDALSEYALSLEDKLGKIPENAVYIPGEDASDEEKTAFNTAMGYPEASDAYKKIDTGLDPSVDFTEGEFSSLAKAALEAKMKPEHVEAFQKWYAKAATDRLAEIAEITKVNTEKMTETYKEKWGEDYKPKYDAMMKAVNHFGGDEFKSYLNKDGLGNFPLVVDFLVEKGLTLNDDSLLEGAAGGAEVPKPTQIAYPSMKGM